MHTPRFSKLLLPAFFICAAACLSSCGGAPSRNSNPRAASTPSASNAAANQPGAAATPAAGLPKIVAFGDSLTAGYGLAPKESYPALLQKMVDSDGFKYEVVNAGVSGDTSADGVRRVDWTLDSGGVRFVVLELGANDFLRGQPVAETKKNLAEIIERCKSRGAQVLLAGMYTTTDAGLDYERQIHECFQALAREHGVALIPFFLEGVAGRDELNQEDRIHPNAEGAKIVAATVYKYLKPLLEKIRGGVEPAEPAGLALPVKGVRARHSNFFRTRLPQNSPARCLHGRQRFCRDYTRGKECGPNGTTDGFQRTRDDTFPAGLSLDGFRPGLSEDLQP